MADGTFTLVATEPGGMAPGRPADHDRLPAEARAWADQQARDELEMLTVLDGERSAALGGEYAVFVVRS